MFAPLLKGAWAGFLATAPMTVLMIALHRLLPWWQRAPLPPHEVTSRTLDAAGLDALDDQHHEWATWAGHFSYGAAAGAFYPLVNRLPLPTLLKSTGYGLLVWAGSYLGWLPASGLLRSAKRRPLQRNLLMMAAHVVWGAAAGTLFRRWRSPQEATD